MKAFTALINPYANTFNATPGNFHTVIKFTVGFSPFGSEFSVGLFEGGYFYF